MNFKMILVIAAIPVLFVGCVSFSFSKTGEEPLQPKDQSCDFEVLTAQPNKPFEEIGTIDPTGGNNATDGPKTTGDFKEAIRVHVCGAGGDAVLGQRNSLGVFIAGTVIRWVE